MVFEECKLGLDIAFSSFHLTIRYTLSNEISLSDLSFCWMKSCRFASVFPYSFWSSIPMNTKVVIASRIGHLGQRSNSANSRWSHIICFDIFYDLVISPAISSHTLSSKLSVSLRVVGIRWFFNRIKCFKEELFLKSPYFWMNFVWTLKYL